MAKEAMEGEKVKKIAEFRTLLEKRVQEMKTELEGMKALLEFVNATLLEKGFKKVEIKKPVSAPVIPETPPPAMEYEEDIPLKTVAGDLLANLHMAKDSMQVVPAEDKEFNISTPPFMSFLVERVLAKMQEKDREAASTGEIAPDRIISYNIARDGDTIREITIRNIESDRLRELKSTICWTLEKMYEKMKTDS